MITVSAKLNGAERLQKKYAKASGKLDKSIQGKLQTIGFRGQRESRLNAKISPPSSSDRGALRKSIQWRVDGNRLFIFVPDNSLAGKYAWLQHDKIKGRGEGTIREGSRAGWKFITRWKDKDEVWIKRTLGESFNSIR